MYPSFRTVLQWNPNVTKCQGTVKISFVLYNGGSFCRCSTVVRNVSTIPLRLYRLLLYGKPFMMKKSILVGILGGTNFAILIAKMDRSSTYFAEFLL